MCRRAVRFAILVLLLPSAVSAGEVGWYLMLPPVAPAKSVLLPPSVETHAPLGEWRQDRGFSSMVACQMYRDVVFKVKRNLADYWLKNEPTDHTKADELNLWRGKVHDAQVAMVAYASGLCIASDDPRLAPPR